VLKVLDLFSGIGGFSRGLEATGFFETVCFVENEPYCQAVLKHHWPGVPILGDIKNVKEPDLPTRPDVICGGFPCQPFSQAGNQQAQDDPRHLWPEMFRLIRECRPTWVVGENVAGLIRLGLDEVLSDLANEGYATRTFNIPACAVGAPHLRQRLWIVAHSDSESGPDKPLDGGEGARQLGFEFVADTESVHGEWSVRKGDSGGKPEKKAGGRGGVVGNTQHDGLPSSEGRGRLLDKSEEQGRQKEIGKSKGASGSSRDVADTQRKGERRRGVSGSGENKSENGKGSSDKFRGCREAVADPDYSRNRTSRRRANRDGKKIDEGQAEQPQSQLGRHSKCITPEEWWEVEPPVGRLVDGLPNRVPQLRALGNSIIPQIAQKIGEAIRETHNETNGTDSQDG